MQSKFEIDVDQIRKVLPLQNLCLERSDLDQKDGMRKLMVRLESSDETNVRHGSDEDLDP